MDYSQNVLPVKVWLHFPETLLDTHSGKPFYPQCMLEASFRYLHTAKDYIQNEAVFHSGDGRYFISIPSDHYSADGVKDGRPVKK